MNLNLFLLLLAVGLISCNYSDRTEDLGSGYLYWHEGGKLNGIFKQIFIKDSLVDEIKIDSIDKYAYDKSHIIVRKEKLDTLNITTNREYKYFFIDKKRDKVIGPLSKEELNNLNLLSLTVGHPNLNFPYLLVEK